MQEPAIVGRAEGVKSAFRLTVLFLLKNQKRFVEESLLGFRGTDTVLCLAFQRIAGVPVEACDPAQIDHSCILP